MHRRQLLAAGGGNLLAGLAGCSGLDGSLLPDGTRHLFAGDTVPVRIADQGTTDHDVETNAREALDFWTAESTQYTGFEIDFEVVESDARMAIEYVDSPERCSNVENYSEDVLGCAPLIEPGQRYSGTATAVVVAGSRPYGQILTTTKHEIGHILGLNHDDAPAEIMSNRPEDRIPLYAERLSIWERSRAANDSAGTATDRFNVGIDEWNSEAYADAGDTFGDAADAYRSARESFATAREETAVFVEFPQPETIDLETLQATLDRLIERMALGVDFAGLMAEAADAAVDGDAATANARRSDANDSIRAYNDLEPTELRDIAVALGLVRGFDRDETVAGEEETI
ncbi:hypothetical protein EGH24_10520 [Halonotius terrestris]|uniref:Peptidase M10 metallopeptidase domain-containing protein n=1 Tax=Halonotius terrestris TaxID=2487750 RepID=A0A8J8P802_9EURY|nr:matrixin family metalloprotease [Halonotius terrestris]TQQ79907.1 hypothetical protein EGH24_10520 [Halonotius terrestris]